MTGADADLTFTEALGARGFPGQWARVSALLDPKVLVLIGNREASTP